MSKTPEPNDLAKEAEREAEEAQLLEDLASFEEELPHGTTAAAQDRALAILYKDEASFLAQRPQGGTRPSSTPTPGVGGDAPALDIEGDHDHESTKASSAP
jgi:hypothetical protein